MKKFNNKIGFLAVIIVVLQLTACKQNVSSYEKIEPSHTELIAGSELSKLTLTERAVERLEIKTAILTEESLGEGYGEQKNRKVVPYASVIYDPHGHTWVYTNPEPLTYIRHEIKIDYIKGDKAYLLEGPPVGTTVATQGVAELYGTESHVGH